MGGENGTPETPDWHVDPKPWDEARCCPDCAGVCTSRQNAIWLNGTDNTIADLLNQHHNRD